jgi:hypothetical protein
VRCAAFECWNCKKLSLTVPFALRPNGDRTEWKCPHCGVHEIGGNTNTMNNCIAFLDDGVVFPWDEEKV